MDIAELQDMKRSAQNAKRSTQPMPAQPINTNPLPSYIPSTPEEIAYEALRSAARTLAQAQHDMQSMAAKILAKPARPT